MKLALNTSLAALLLWGCQGPNSAVTSGSSLVSAAPTSPPSAKASATVDELETAPVEILKFTFASGVSAREPIDKLSSAKPGSRVYAHMTVRNRTGRPRTIHLEFSVDGKKRTELDLKIQESWSFRSWGYNTLQPKDQGVLKVELSDDEGNSLGEYTLPIDSGT
jgi:hypothetical protein